jgi:Spy/CpxP family protein refolding chaperone
MRKIVLSLAALVALSFAIPFAAAPAMAETVVIHRHHNHYWNYAPHRDRTVIVKHHDW